MFIIRKHPLLIGVSSLIIIIFSQKYPILAIIRSTLIVTAFNLISSQYVLISIYATTIIAIIIILRVFFLVYTLYIIYTYYDTACKT